MIHLYRKLLWFLGFPKGEYITFMLKRQEKRLGVIWWLLIASTQSWANVMLHTYLSTNWFVILSYPVNIVLIILVWHVATTKEVDSGK